MRTNRKLQLICGLTLYLMACAPIKNSQYEYYSTLVSETKECLENHAYPTSTTLTGTALFFKRGLNLVLESGALKNLSLGDPLITGLPIRYAEVAVYNSTKEIVQCGITDSLGFLKAIDGTSD